MAKYDTMRKLERNRMLLEYREKHPDLSLREIGRLFNITPQRVWGIIQGENKKARAS